MLARLLLGQKILDADIQVVNNLPAHGVRIYNGADRSTYSCAPYCQPSPVLGDSPQFIGSNQGRATAINNNVASGAASSPFSGGGFQSGGSSRGASSSSALSGPPAGQVVDGPPPPR